jgi:hypothetical protein
VGKIIVMNSNPLSALIRTCREQKEACIEGEENIGFENFLSHAQRAFSLELIDRRLPKKYYKDEVKFLGTQLDEKYKKLSIFQYCIDYVLRTKKDEYVEVVVIELPNEKRYSKIEQICQTICSKWKGGASLSVEVLANRYRLKFKLVC